MNTHDSGPIDLTAAEKVASISVERQAWLRAMLEPGGLTPGSSSRARARAFRFAEALRKAGYRVTEAPLGPRGGRRFTLDGYGGPRAGLVYRLKLYCDCAFDYALDECDCFDSLTDQELQLVSSVLRKTRRVWGMVPPTTDLIAALLRQVGEAKLRTATDLYVDADTGRICGPPLEGYLFLVERHPVEQVQKAISLFKTARGTLLGGPNLAALVRLLERHDIETLRAATEVFARAGGTLRGGSAFEELVAALESADC